ncbi:UTRA domain-containing protein [Pseudomonas sp. GD04087]|uniref:UTRA domain-containing protein n=1 Tax=unclassified Pseudomonas TaxID=196821 RepID=UPI00244B3726|nr:MULTISPECIES: UTRA domain-containing protein [unclassified Pseudomonas]MDH0290995.1 UTRA domain-containing protein [Pseudomonas sp. GD04087]MDH1050247.1 UTRA domain-containing protein [Pseudomonas sp. GD03903]MDH1998729.1 UTRA domain-containing protein [Pseudomonas sp. GD03691]
MLYQAIPPHYARIRDQLAADIAQGRFLAGQKLPPERDLAERFECTRVTLRQALQQLETEGLIYRENRRGWYLSPPRIDYDPTRLVSFMDYVRLQGREPLTECLSAERRRAGAWLAARMNLPSPDEPVFRLHRRRLIDGRPVLVEINTLLASWCPDLLDARLDRSLTTVLRERFGKLQTRCTLNLRLGTVNDDHAELLQLASGASNLVLERLNYAEDGLLVEFDQEFWRPDAVSVAVQADFPARPLIAE